MGELFTDLQSQLVIYKNKTKKSKYDDLIESIKALIFNYDILQKKPLHNPPRDVSVHSSTSSLFENALH